MASPPPSPIRTAIIGLSASAATSWASSAHLPYLLSAAGSARYQIVALCNSSVDAARRAISHYRLDPAAVTAYGDAEALARDPAVQLVVCATRVDTHYALALPSARAGKDVYVEWPLAADAGQAEELVRVSREKGSRTVVGLQGKFAPGVRKVRELVEGGRVGRVVSAEVRAFGGSNDREVLPVGLRYFAERKVGGNVFTIGFGHLFDYVQSALGDLQDIQSHLSLQRPAVKIRDPSSGQIVETIQSDVPDLVHVTGSLPASAHTQAGATVHLQFRRGQPFKGEDPLVWTVTGEKGEIRLRSQSGPAIQAMAHTEDGLTIELYDFATDTVQNVAWEWPAARAELGVVARNIGALYEAFAEGDEAEYPTFEHALKRHRQLDEMLAKFSP